MLIEVGACTVLFVEAVAADGAEVTGLGALDGDEPAEGFEADFEGFGVRHGFAAEDEGLAEACVVIGDIGFEPGPMLSGGVVPKVDEFFGQGLAHGMDLGLGIIGMVTEVFVDPEQSEAPGARGGERSDDGEADAEELSGEVAMTLVARAASAVADGPERAAVAVFATGFLKPEATMAHEVAEAAGLIVEGGGEEGKVAGGEVIEVLRGRLSAKFIEEVAEDEGAGVIVGAVAFVEIGDIKDGVLVDAGAVRHAHDVIEAERGQGVGAAAEGPAGEGGAGGGFAIGSSVLEGIQVAFGGFRPDHGAPHGVGVLADAVEALRVVQEIADTGGDGFGVAEGDKNAAVVGEQFLGMPVGGGDDGFAGAENVSERA